MFFASLAWRESDSPGQYWSRVARRPAKPDDQNTPAEWRTHKPLVKSGACVFVIQQECCRRVAAAWRAGSRYPEKSCDERNVKLGFKQECRELDVFRVLGLARVRFARSVLVTCRTSAGEAGRPEHSR